MEEVPFSKIPRGRGWDWTNHEGFFLASMICSIANLVLVFNMLVWLSSLEYRQVTPKEAISALKLRLLVELSLAWVVVGLFLFGGYNWEFAVSLVFAVGLMCKIWFGSSLSVTYLNDKLASFQLESYLKIAVYFSVVVIFLARIVLLVDNVFIGDLTEFRR